MNFLRLPDNLPGVLFEDDDIIAIDKPYGFNAHTNDSKIEHSEHIQDGLIEIYEKLLGKKLHIVHRLDQTTTGVMIFGKSVESTKKYADYFFQRLVKKTYVFITRFKSSQDHFHVTQSIFHKDRELDAETELRKIKEVNGFELWEALPHTGRNHQIRIHAQHVGLSILGDPKYSGHAHPFLCLHNRKIEFPNGLIIESRLPDCFAHLEILDNPLLAQVLFESDRRYRLFKKDLSSDQSYRLCLENFTLDKLGPQGVLQWEKDYYSEEDKYLFSKISHQLDIPLIVKQGDRLLWPEAIQNADWIAMEDDVKFHIRGLAGKSTGLYLDQRLQRRWVLENSENKNVLNLFSTTCGFGLSAALGKAKSVTSIENSKNLLNWGRENFKLNNLKDEDYRFLFRDSFSYIEGSLKKNETFDLIIVDTPSFMKRDKGVFKIKSDLLEWIKNLLRCLNKNGVLLFSTRAEGIFIPDIQRTFLQAKKDLGLKNLEIDCILPSLDFELPQQRAQLKSFIIQL